MDEINDLLPCPMCGSPAKENNVGYPSDSTGYGIWFKAVSCTNRDCPLSKVIIRREEWQNRRHTYHKDFVHYWGEVKNIIKKSYPERSDQQKILMYMEFAFKSGFEAGQHTKEQ